MGNDNRISIEVSATNIQAMIAAIDSIKSKLPFLISLLPEERKEMPKMGDKSVPFVSKCVEYAEAEAGQLPVYIELTEFAKDVKLLKDLLKVLRPLQQLTEAIDDTITITGSEAYIAALSYYNYKKGAMKSGQSGAKTIVEDLGKRFPGRRGKGGSTSGGNTEE